MGTFSTCCLFQTKIYKFLQQSAHLGRSSIRDRQVKKLVKFGFSAILMNFSMFRKSLLFYKWPIFQDCARCKFESRHFYKKAKTSNLGSKLLKINFNETFQASRFKCFLQLSKFRDYPCSKLESRLCYITERKWAKISILGAKLKICLKSSLVAILMKFYAFRVKCFLQTGKLSSRCLLKN